MTDSPKAPVIALEEHYMDPLVAADRGTARRPWPEYVASGLADLGELRLREMDEAGIDVQVLSHVSSPVQQVDPKSALDLAIGGNDRLAEAIARHPDRFAGFAALPTPDPEAAASELERCVIDLGFKGAMIHGRSQGRFHDHERFWPIYERAEALDVPIYLHSIHLARDVVVPRTLRKLPINSPSDSSSIWIVAKVGIARKDSWEHESVETRTVQQELLC